MIVLIASYEHHDNQTCRPRFICPKYLWSRVVNTLIKGVLQTCAQKQALSNSCLSSVGNKSVWASCYVQTAQPQHIFLDDYDIHWHTMTRDASPSLQGPLVIFKTRSLPQTVLKAVQLLGEILSSESVKWSNVIGSHMVTPRERFQNSWLWF